MRLRCHHFSGERDYIHVVDLADGHLKALQAIASQSGVHVWNLGTCTGYSVLEMVRAFEQASGRPVSYRIAPRRPRRHRRMLGRSGQGRPRAGLGWKAERGLEAMMVDTWRWQSGNPQGYGE